MLIGEKQSAVKTAEYESTLSRGALIVLVMLLLGETTINYIDRQVLSVLAPRYAASFS